MKNYLKLAAVSFLLGSCSGTVENKEELVNPNDSLMAVATTRVSVHNEWLTSMKNISKTLDSIHDRSKIIYLKTRDRSEFPPVVITEINQQIRTLNAFLKMNEEEISTLNKKLNGAGALNKTLEDSIFQLNKRLTEKQSELMDLYGLFAELDEDFYDLQASLYTLYIQNAAQNNTIVKSIREANTAYFITGTLKELQRKGVVTSDGLLSAFKNTTVNSEIDPLALNRMDIREKKDFAINSKHAKLLTIHSTGSYRFEKDKKQIKRLVITDPSEFWRISRYLVIKID